MPWYADTMTREGKGQTRHPYAVRKQSSGRTFSETYIVIHRPSKGRVTTWAHGTRESAQAEADQLNIGEMVKDYDEDQRPYDVRRAEAEAAYHAEQTP